MQVLLKGLVLEELLRGILFGAEIDDFDGPDSRHWSLGFLEGFENFDDERPHFQQWIVGKFLFIEIDIIEVHINEVK